MAVRIAEDVNDSELTVILCLNPSFRKLSAAVGFLALRITGRYDRMKHIRDGMALCLMA